MIFPKRITAIKIADLDLEKIKLKNIFLKLKKVGKYFRKWEKYLKIFFGD